MKILLLTLFALPFSMLFAQGNLQFNQVLTPSGSISVGGTGNKVYSPAETVPSSKVWKVEYIGASFAPFSSSTLLNSVSWGITINSQDLVVSITNNPTSMTSPIWLKAGDQLGFVSGGNGVSGSVKYVFSIIEFNIIP